MLVNIKKARSVKIFLPLLLIIGLLFAAGCASAPSKGWSGPVVSDNVLYVGTIKGKVIALDATTGELLKPEFKELDKQSSSVFSCGGGISTPMSIYGTPVVKDVVVYIGGYGGEIYAVNTNGSSYNPYDIGGNIIGSPVIDEDTDTLFVGNSDGKLYALSTSADTILQDKWTEPFKAGGAIWSTPAVSDGVVYVTSTNHRLYAVDAASGEEIWQFKAGAGILSTPVVYGNYVYVGACDNKFYAIDKATGTKTWEFEADNWFWTQALINDDVIWASCLDGNVYALNIETGAEIWHLETDGRVRTPPIAVNGEIIVGSEDGYLYSIDPVNKTSKTLGENLDAPIFAPIVAGAITINDETVNVIYVHAQNGSHELYAINAETGSVVWGPYKTS